MVRFVEDGGDEPVEGVAPVIQLFGAASPVRPRVDTARAAGWHGTWDAPAPHGGRPPEPIERVARVERDERPRAAAVGRGRRAGLSGGSDAESGSTREAAENRLLKKLRTRSLSVSEARTVLREADLDTSAVSEIIEGFEQLGYLDDAALAEQLIHSAVDRKGQGRRAIAQTLAKRGVSRDVADTAIAALPDDDSERALEFARSKARSMRSLDRDTALRRLAGQLARRGYGAQSLSAARTALDEIS